MTQHYLHNVMLSIENSNRGKRITVNVCEDVFYYNILDKKLELKDSGERNAPRSVTKCHDSQGHIS